MTTRMARRVAALLLAPALWGCASGGGPPAGRVEGRLTFRGAPVAEGVVLFSDDQGNNDEAKLGAGGRFELPRELPVGRYVVTVTPPVVMDMGDAKTSPGPVEKRVRDIPERYRRVGSSPLRADVKEGPNTFAFDLVP